LPVSVILLSNDVLVIHTLASSSVSHTKFSASSALLSILIVSHHITAKELGVFIILSLSHKNLKYLEYTLAGAHHFNSASASAFNMEAILSVSVVSHHFLAIFNKSACRTACANAISACSGLTLNSSDTLAKDAHQNCCAHNIFSPAS